MVQVLLDEGLAQGEVWGEVVEGVEEWAREREDRVWEAVAEGPVQVETACAPVVAPPEPISAEPPVHRSDAPGAVRP